MFEQEIIQIWTSEEEFQNWWQKEPVPALDHIKFLRDKLNCLPSSKEAKHFGKKPSNAELKRWFANKCIQINNKIVSETEEIFFPITNLVLFPNNKKAKCTLV